MLERSLADKLAKVAQQQLSEGLEAKSKRMDIVSEIMDLYNNKTIELDTDMMNIPFPVLAGHIDTLFSKIDDSPGLEFKIPNKPSLSDKVKAAWVMEMSSTRAGWKRKDRAEKKLALLSGRGVAKVFASSVLNEYKSHYEIVDIFSFVADPTRGWLEDGNYHGETDIFKTTAEIKRGVKAGFYDTTNAQLLINRKDTEKNGQEQVVKNKFNRLRTMGIDVQSTSFAGQEGVNMTEWIMRHDNEWYYLFFDPATGVWLRAELLKDVFKNGKTPYTSWATHYDEFNFWSKGAADDVYPIAEAIRFLLNNALENEKRRVRPMRIVDSGALVDVNELMDYVPDNVILSNPGKNPNIVTVETFGTSATIDMAQFFDAMIKDKSGVADEGISEADPKVGVYYGRLQQEADRIGIINKEYSESYAHKGYRFFWGLKQHLTGRKQIELLGKQGIKLSEISKVDFKDVDDVDDIIVSGGSKEAETTAVEQQNQLKAINELTATYPDILNPQWVASAVLKRSGFEEEDIQEALDKDSVLNKETLEEADEAIQSILLGVTPQLNMAADIAFAQRIIDYAHNELNWVQIDKDGNEVGIDRRMKEHFDRLLKYVDAHQKIIMDNMQRKATKMAMIDQMAQIAPQGPNPQWAGVNVQPQGGNPNAQSIAPDQAPPVGTPAGTQSLSGTASAMMTP